MDGQTDMTKRIVAFLNFAKATNNVRIKIYRTLILPVVFHGCETWFLILRKKHRSRMFENRMLKKIFDPQRGDAKEN
jgi:hypothetical protein